MAANPLRAVVDVIAGASNLTRSSAEEVLTIAAANRSLLEDVVRSEIEAQLARVGLASRGELLAAQSEVIRLRAEIEQLQSRVAATHEDRAPRGYSLTGFEPEESTAQLGGQPVAVTRKATERRPNRNTMKRAAKAAGNAPTSRSMAGAKSETGSRSAGKRRASATKTASATRPSGTSTPAKSTVKKTASSAAAKKTVTKKAVTKKSAAKKAAAKKAVATKKSAGTKTQTSTSGNPS